MYPDPAVDQSTELQLKGNKTTIPPLKTKVNSDHQILTREQRDEA